MLYKFDTDNSILKEKSIRSVDIEFRVGEIIEQGDLVYQIRYIRHVFNYGGTYVETRVGLDR